MNEVFAPNCTPPRRALGASFHKSRLALMGLRAKLAWRYHLDFLSSTGQLWPGNHQVRGEFCRVGLDVGQTCPNPSGNLPESGRIRPKSAHGRSNPGQLRLKFGRHRSTWSRNWPNSGKTSADFDRMCGDVGQNRDDSVQVAAGRRRPGRVCCGFRCAHRFRVFGYLGGAANGESSRHRAKNGTLFLQATP